MRMMPTAEKHVPTDVTPDGRTLIYTEIFDEHWEIMGLPTDGSGDPVLVVDGRPSWRGAAAISPNGRWLAYRSDESGAGTGLSGFEIYVEPYPGPGARVPVSIGGGLEPVWSADGRELYYRRGDDMMIAAEIRGDATPEVSGRTELFSLGPYRPVVGATIHTFHVAPDGRFLTMRRAEGADVGTIDPTPGVVMVLNWFEELRERVPN